jgi:hypothetical protein
MYSSHYTLKQLVEQRVADLRPEGPARRKGLHDSERAFGHKKASWPVRGSVQIIGQPRSHLPIIARGVAWLDDDPSEGRRS